MAWDTGSGNNDLDDLRRASDLSEKDRADAPDDSPHAEDATDRTGPRTGRFAQRILDPVGRFFGLTVFSSLIRRIVVINMAGLVILVVGILYFNSWRDGLIEARVQSLRVQGEIISAAIAASASVDSNVISVDPDLLLELQGNAPVSPLSFFDPALEFPISPERVAPLLRALISPTHTRARIYDTNGLLILDSNDIYLSGEVLSRPGRTPMPDPWWQVWWDRVMTFVPGDEFPLYQEHGATEGRNYPEVALALAGSPADIVRVDSRGDLVVSVSVPVKRLRATVGALLLSTEPGAIDSIVAAERLGILRVALVAVAVTALLSIFLARTIAGPMRRLSAAAEEVQASMSSGAQIPDFADRADEIGHLSRALRDMTASLFNRMQAIESFAADVAHELKNPLTSLRSAVETLPLAKSKQSQDRLMEVIQHDVRRLDRLISDISDASRLDAELARIQAETIDISELLRNMADAANQRSGDEEASVKLTVADAQGAKPYHAQGHDIRLGQVISNLLDNARSFSPPGGTVHVDLCREGRMIRITVDDDGPGIRAENTERIFERFYTDRPDGEGFGNNSGLGLSISRQIIEAHGGTIAATNRIEQDSDGSRKIGGARFTIYLPAGPGK